MGILACGGNFCHSLNLPLHLNCPTRLTLFSAIVLFEVHLSKQYLVQGWKFWSALTAAFLIRPKAIPWVLWLVSLARCLTMWAGYENHLD